jgi:tetratricopeptide (TPR) repeat protein
MPPGMGVDHPEALAEARFDFAEAPVERPPYEDEGLSQLLAGYRDRFADARFTMPVEFLGAVRHVARSVPAPAAWLIGDYGHFSDEEIREEQTTALVRHGEFFSLPVNFDALCRYATRLGGGWLAAPDWSKRFHVAALFTGGVPTDFPHAHDAFHAAMDWPGPRDIRRLVKAVCGARDIAAGYALNALRLANYDPLVFADLHPQLCRVASNAKPRERRELGTALERVRANLYPVATRPDVVYQLAVLYAALGRYGEAIELFQQSIRERGDNCRRWFGWALCEADRGDTPRALELAARARELEPDNEHLAEFLRELGGE